MKKTTLSKLVKQALLEVLLEQRQTDNIQISPKTLLKLKEGLNPDEKQEIYTFLSNKTKKSTTGKAIPVSPNKIKAIKAINAPIINISP